MRRRRIWAETVEPAVLRGARATALLRRFGLDVLVAVRPDSLGELGRTLDVLGGEGIAAGVWPMLDDAQGRWASARNAAEFTAFTRRVAEVVGARPVTELVVDLEPPIDEVRAALGGLRGAARALGRARDGRRMDEARAEFAFLVRDLDARGVRTTVVAPPMLLLDRAARTSRWETLLGTPLSGPVWRAVHVMLYTSLLEGYSRGLLDRAGALAVLAEGCRATAARFGAAGAVSLGAVGVGALGDEPVYRSPTELARDVAVARACGIDDLALFDLGGVLARAPSEAWLDAFVEDPPHAPAPRTLRGSAAVWFARATGAAIDALAQRAGSSRFA